MLRLFNARTALQLLLVTCLFTLACSFCQAQVFNGKNLKWDLTKSEEPRLKFIFGTTGINIGGYEGTSLITENVTDAKLYVEVNLTYIDICGEQKTRLIKVSVKPHDKVGGSTWMGGDEQHDYQTKCTERKIYAPNFKTRLSNVKLDIVSIKNLTTGETTYGPGNTTGGNTTTGNSNTASTNSSGNNVSGNCPTYGFKINGTPGITCVALEWWALSTKTNSVDAAGNFKQSNDPEPTAFTIQYRRQGNYSWISDRQPNGGRNQYTIINLDACTDYEVRMITHCNNNTSSQPTTIVRFTTACPMPPELTISNITGTSAQVGSKNPVNVSYSCQVIKPYPRVIEYKTGTGQWEETICNSGSVCTLNGLVPGSVYRVRAKYKFDYNRYSGYTNEVSFTTTGSGSQPGNTGGYTGTTTGPLSAPSGLSGTRYYELSWLGVSGASSYEIQTAASSAGLASASVYSSPTNKYSITGTQGTTLYWRVRARGSNGSTSAWSAVQSVTF